MNKTRLLNIALWFGVICIATNNTAIAKQRSRHVRNLQMTERNAQECTQLLDKLAATDQKILADMGIRRTRAAETSALLAIQNTSSLNELFDKRVPLIRNTNVKPITLSTQAKVVIKPVAPIKQDIATKNVVAKLDDKALLPKHIQVFASDDLRAIDHLTGKNTLPLMSTPDYGKPITTKSRRISSNKTFKVRTKTHLKPKVKPKKIAKPQPQLQPKPRIRLFAPNGDSVELNGLNLEGKSANLKELAKPKRSVPKKPQKTDTSAIKNTKKEPS